MTRWSDQLRGLLDDATPQAALRVSRGRAYERSGRVTDLRTAPGLLTGRVQGSRATPYLVEIGVPVLQDGAWERIVRAVADQVRHGARLSSGQAPQGLEDELEAEGISLFPHPAELAPSCGCEDPSVWCKHVAAVVEAAARRLDEDAFLLLHIRGRGRERFLAEVAAGRAGSGEDQSWNVSAIPVSEWTASRAPLKLAGQSARPSASPDGTAVLRILSGLGDPPGWAGGIGAADLFGPLIQRGVRWAALQIEDVQEDVQEANKEDAQG